jgi:hypothetical protein
MDTPFLKTFIKYWDFLFKNHPWLEAFTLSVFVHVIFLIFLWSCCEIYSAVFPQKEIKKIIQIEFIK